MIHSARGDRRVVCLAILALLLLTANSLHAEEFYVPGATLYRGNTALSDFTLADHQGQAFDLARLRGRWTVMYFGYLSCPDACPTTNFVMKNVFANLWGDKSPQQSGWQYVFVSLDPGRDTPDQLREYIDYFDSRFVGLAGDLTQLETLTAKADIDFVYRSAATGRVTADYHEFAAGENYYVDHTTSLVVIGPEAQLIALVHATKDPASVTDILREIRAHYQK